MASPIPVPTGRIAPAQQSRLVISEDVMKKMKGAAKVAILALSVAAKATQDVPYLGAISTALTEFMKIQDEVDQCKDECKAAMGDAEGMNKLIKKFRRKCEESGKGDGLLNESLREAFAELEEIVLECILTLEKCKVNSTRKRDRVLLYLKRSELAKSVKECSSKMGKALQQFNTTLQVDQVIILEEIRLTVNELREARSSSAQQLATSVIPSFWKLRAANPIFHGRESEVEAAVNLIVNKAPARVAILGPGGIGKTSIALAVLHNTSVKRLYGDRRCFMSCEATTTAEAVVRALADALGLTLETTLSTESARHSLMQSLSGISGIICVDNLETPLDADKRAVEELLHDISALPSVALLVTSRDTSIPTLKWTSPRLEHIKPFSREAALATWDDICHGHDEYALQLIKSVDRMPLAVTLLARLASVEGSAKSIWARWETERTDLIRTGHDEHRLLNVSASIELSLRSLGHSAEAVTVMSIISIFPSGLWDSEISMLHDALNDRLSVRRAVTLLRQLSLVYTEPRDEQDLIRMLSPIRYHIQQHHISDKPFLLLLDAMIQQQEDWGQSDWNEVLWSSFHRPGSCRERCVDFVVSAPERTLDIELLSQAIGKARKLEPQIQSKLHRRLGYAFNEVRVFEKARSSFSQAIEIDEQLGDRQALFVDWGLWIWTFRFEFGGREDKCQHLDEVQDAIQKAWELGRDESGAWDQDFGDYQDIAWYQHFVNEGRRKLHMPVVHRSGLYTGWDNDSTVFLGYDSELRSTYDQLVSTSSPPWDLSLILETIEMLHSAREESTSGSSTVSFEGSVNLE